MTEENKEMQRAIAELLKGSQMVGGRVILAGGEYADESNSEPQKQYGSEGDEICPNCHRWVGSFCICH